MTTSDATIGQVAEQNTFANAPRSPRWVECAEKAAEALEQDRIDLSEHWRRLAETFKSA